MKFERLLDKLANDESFTEAEIDIGKYTHDRWSQLIQCLASNKTLEELEIVRSEYRRRFFGGENLEGFFQAIGNLPKLKTLELMYLSASDLATIQGTFANFRGVEELSIDLAENSPPISPEVARSIASIPKLRRFSIVTHGSFAVSSLFSPHIEEILAEAPNDIPFENDHLRLIVDDLSTNMFTNLRTVELNWLTIRNFQLPLVVSLLKENTTLQTLSLTLSIPAENVEECCETIIEAISHNSVLKSFVNCYRFDWDKIVSPATRKLQNQMLHHNTTLEEFDLFKADDFFKAEDKKSPPTDAEREKNLLLRLNKAGRKRLMSAKAASVNDWIDVMTHEEVRDDIPCLFHLLRMNPSLCSTNTGIGRKRNLSQI